MPIYCKKGWYYVNVMVKGKRWFPSDVGMTVKRWKTKREAKSAEVELRKRITMLSVEAVTDTVLLTICNKYLDDQEKRHIGHDTYKTKQRFCKDMLGSFGNIPMTSLKAHDVQAFLNGKLEKVSANTYNVCRKEGLRLFRWAVNQQLVPADTVNPFERVEKMPYRPQKTGPAPLQDVLKVFEVASPEQRDILEGYVLTGARKNELLSLTHDDLDFSNRVYTLRTRKTKGGVEKVTAYPMSKALRKLFKRKMDNRHRDLPYVFWHKYWDRAEKDWTVDRYKSLNRFTERLCKKAGVPIFGLHQLRHLAATILKEEAGMGISKLQKFLRHEDQKTTEIYAGFLDTDTGEQVDFLSEFWDGKLSTLELK